MIIGSSIVHPGTQQWMSLIQCQPWLLNNPFMHTEKHLFMKGAAIRNVVLLRFTNNPPEFTSHCHIASTKTHVASTMTPWLFTSMALPSNVTNHSPVLPTIHFCTTGTTFEMASTSCAQWTCYIMLVLHCRFTTRQLTHTTWSAGMTGTPLRVCAPSPLPSSGTLCCWLKQTLSVANLQPPDGRLQDAMHSPTSVHTTPASQSGPVEQKTVWPTPLSAANPHPPDGRLQDAVHSPVSVHTTPASQSGPAPSLMLSRRHK